MLSISNKVQLIGFLGAEPETKNLESGKKVTRFSLATNESYKNANGEKVTDTQWHNIVAWGKVAELAETLLKKGSHLAIEGKLTSRSYTDVNGNGRAITEIQLNEFLLLDKAN